MLNVVSIDSSLAKMDIQLRCLWLFYALRIKKNMFNNGNQFQITTNTTFSFHNMLLLRFQDNVTLKQIFKLSFI